MSMRLHNECPWTLSPYFEYPYPVSLELLLIYISASQKVNHPKRVNYTIMPATLTLDIGHTMNVLHSISDDPLWLGQACGELMQIITTLVTYHLDHAASHRNGLVPACIDTLEFTSAIDKALEDMRNADGVTEPFPDDLLVDRKQRRPRRKYKEKYIELLETMFRNHIEAQLTVVFGGYGSETTQDFNKGINLGLGGSPWRVYPSSNVVLHAGGEDWGQWLKKRCEQLGTTSARQGLPVFEFES